VTSPRTWRCWLVACRTDDTRPCQSMPRLFFDASEDYWKCSYLANGCRMAELRHFSAI
jgi:hypothetical protein